MRHKYATTGITLARQPLSEASLLVSFLTPDLGLVRARVQGIRKPAAKLSAALQTLSESEAMLVRGKEGWRINNAVLTVNWFSELPLQARPIAGRIASMLLRLVPGESADPEIYRAFRDFLDALKRVSPQEYDPAECLAALRIVRALGLDAGGLPAEAFDTASLKAVANDRSSVIARINHGLAASGL